MNKILFKIFVIIILIIVGFCLLYSPVIFQEGNPWPEIEGIVQLDFGREDIVKLSGTENKYLTKSRNGKEVIIDFMQAKDYRFTEQMGSGYFFKSFDGSKGAVVTHRYYSRYYSIWNITENKQKVADNIAEELKDCLPKSDLASQEKCEALIKTINNFDDCVKAGFSILKSKPLQCATPDGRVFIEGTNSTWEMALSAINNCEVAEVFQSHSLLVDLKLKNGNSLITYEPQIDMVMKVLQDTKEKCGDIIMATE